MTDKNFMSIKDAGKIGFLVNGADLMPFQV